ncbi:response regulator transcription factor [Comamonas sp. SY3]|uniref:response regulator transcription factor n=1 Tax=Comamonas sp. SY3 TaxID=3243601 RepID=UPI003593BEDB
MTRVLIVEDNPELVGCLYAFLEPLGYVLDDARDGLTGLRTATQNDYDAVLLDVTLPQLDGLALCRRLRQEFQNPVPVLMLTAQASVDDRVRGLAQGADDYLVKPFSLQELHARIQAIVRRAQCRLVQGSLVWEDLTVDTQLPQAWRQGQHISLTPTTHKLLLCLMRAAPAVVRKQEMVYLLWGDEPPASDALRTHIHDLRQQIGRNFSSALIKTVHGIGWSLDRGQDAA